MRAKVGPILPLTPRMTRSESSLSRAAKAAGEGSESSRSSSSTVRGPGVVACLSILLANAAVLIVFLFR